jgi:hypothetical protein
MIDFMRTKASGNVSEKKFLLYQKASKKFHGHIASNSIYIFYEKLNAVNNRTIHLI